MKVMITTRFNAGGTDGGTAVDVTIVEYTHLQYAKEAADIINGKQPDLVGNTKDSNMRLYQSAIVLP